MTRWTDAGKNVDGTTYDARFAAMAARGMDVHGEASFCSALVPAPARVLDAGCGTGRVAIRLAELGYECVGVDVDEPMLAQARRRAPEQAWLLADLAGLDLAPHGLPGPYDLVVAAGNVLPLVAAGTEASVLVALAAHLGTGGRLVAGFGLDAAHLPLDDAPFGLGDYDAWCYGAGLELEDRFASWDGQPYTGGGYAVSVHRRAYTGGMSRSEP